MSAIVKHGNGHWFRLLSDRLRRLDEDRVPRCSKCRNWMLSSNEPDGPWHCAFCKESE